MVGSMICVLLAVAPAVQTPEPAEVASDADRELDSDPAGEDPVVDPQAREAARLFDTGQAKYETHDYAGAIADFTAAYDLAFALDDSELRDEALARLAFNLARAHVYAHDLDASAGHLATARRLLADYRGHERNHGRDPDADTDVRALEVDLREREAAVTGELERTRSRRHRRVGIGLLATAPAFAGLAVTGAVLGARARDSFETATTGESRLDARNRGQVSDVLFGVGVGLTAVAAIAGVTLVVVGRGANPKTERVALQVRPTGMGLEARF
jgi:hypothetical protein